jgi:hypothetical protein
MSYSRVAALMAIGLTAGACGPSADQAHEFALYGDSPYSPESIPKVQALIADVNARGGLEWVIHVGDTKGGSQPCSDERLRGRFDLYQGFAIPFVLTPGDNDWFDCVSEAAGRHDEYERLDFVRSLYFKEPTRTTGGRTMTVESQASDPGHAEFVENALWFRGGVVYATVHLVALSREPTDPDVAARRAAAASSWISRAFALARERGSAGVFIATQADPWRVSGLPGVLRGVCPACLEPVPGLEELYPLLVKESTAFAGEVVLAVGDTHVFRVDKPLYREDRSLVENFTRVETFGEPNVHWVRVTVDSEAREVFSFHQERVPEN